MSLAKITMTGQEIWLKHKNGSSLFDLFILPEDIDRDTCIDNIMLECGELETLYSEPEFMRAAIGVWSKKHYWTFDKWAKAIKIEYSPLENYDRFEDWWDHSDKDNDNTRTLDHQDKRTLDTQNKRTLDTQDEETRDISDKTTYDKTTTTENEVSAFDSSSYQPADKSTMDEDGTVTVDGTGTDTFAHTGTDTVDNTGTDTLSNTGTDTLSNTGTDTLTNTGTDTVNNTGTDTMDNTGTDTVDYSGTIKDEGGETVDSSHGGRIHGNIGVTTSQQMLQSELDIARFNLINQITDLFLTELCICVYD